MWNRNSTRQCFSSTNSGTDQGINSIEDLFKVRTFAPYGVEVSTDHSNAVDVIPAASSIPGELSEENDLSGGVTTISDLFKTKMLCSPFLTKSKDDERVEEMTSDELSMNLKALPVLSRHQCNIQEGTVSPGAPKRPKPVFHCLTFDQEHGFQFDSFPSAFCHYGFDVLQICPPLLDNNHAQNREGSAKYHSDTSVINLAVQLANLGDFNSKEFGSEYYPLQNSFGITGSKKTAGIKGKDHVKSIKKNYNEFEGKLSYSKESAKGAGSSVTLNHMSKGKKAAGWNLHQETGHLLNKSSLNRSKNINTEGSVQYLLPSRSGCNRKSLGIYSGSSGRPIKRECGFCRTNGETPATYRSHTVKDDVGRTTCHVLQQYTCPCCGATGVFAHTLKYCPLNKSPSTLATMSTLKSMRLSTGKLRQRAALFGGAHFETRPSF